MRPVLDYKRFLPHKQGSDSVLFVTWRQNFTLPQAILQKMAEHKSAWDKAHSPGEDKFAYNKERFELYDSELVKYNHPSYSLCHPDIAAIVKDAFHFYAEKKYCLHSYCIMSNHIHILFQPLKDQNVNSYHLTKIVQGLKSYTAKKINQLLDSSGRVWEKGYFDRIIRNETDYWNVVEYILNNPVKARVVKNWEDYPYSYWNSLLQQRYGLKKT